MNTTNNELAIMIEQACAVVSAVEEPIGYPGWWSQQHLLSMIAAISDVFNINAEEDALITLIGAVDNIGTTKYKAAVKLLRLLKPGQMAVFTGVMFPEAAKLRARALGTAYIEVCKAVKLGKLDANEIVADKGIRLLETEFNRRLKEGKRAD